MTPDVLSQVPADRRDVALAALTTAFGHTAMTPLQPVGGGASGALLYRVDVGDRAYLLRMETRRSPLRNPHQYACLQIAADASIAPPPLHVDADAGVVIMAFHAPRPLQEYPGGPLTLARDLGQLAARLQATPVFPAFRDYLTSLERMLKLVRGSTLFAPGLLDPHCEAFDRIREVYPWDAGTFVSSHNDPNPRNILFDGTRLWLVDWETAGRNDPFIDVAILVDSLAPTPALRDALLQAWLGRTPDRAALARLTLARQLTRLYYAALMLSLAAMAPRSTPPDADLSAPTPAELQAAISAGRVSATGPDMLYTLAKMCLERFMRDLETTEFAESLGVARAG
jgi:Ser/Thr protein kinase RdoA (MazF antagonist)